MKRIRFRTNLAAVAAVAGLTLTAVAEPAAPAMTLEQGKEAWTLKSGDRVVWQLNFGPKFAKPCLHPFTFADGREVTALRPPDHRWHTGLWFSWKYLNGVNYWEEDPKTGRSEGTTELTGLRGQRRGGVTTVELGLSYHKPGEAAVLTEKRTLNFRDPDAHGDLVLDWTSVFTAGPAEVKFDRTPPVKKKDGTGTGGYAGLALRINPALKTGTFLGSDGGKGVPALFGKHLKWMDFSAAEKDGGAGVTIFDHPANPRHPTPWYPNAGYPFFSPAFLFDEPFVLAAGGSFTLRYRVWIHNAPADAAALAAAAAAFAAP